MTEAPELRERWVRNRDFTRRFFREILTPEAWLERPIPLRNPFVFYDGHIAAFAVNTLLKRALGRSGIDAGYEVLFERGIDPLDASSVTAPAWPARECVEEYVRAADEGVAAVFESGMSPSALEGVIVILEHEEMHQETLQYMLHRLPYALKREPAGAEPLEGGGPAPPPRVARVPAGRAALGAPADGAVFRWDNELPERTVELGAFGMDVHPVTNERFLDFVEAGGYANRDLWSEDAFRWLTRDRVEMPAFWIRRSGRWLWRAQFHEIPLPPSWPVFVSHAEASAYARWKGRRLPSEAEYHRAAFSRPSGRDAEFPWGDDVGAERGNFGFRRWDPVSVGRFPSAASAWGIEDLVGNGWEWTATPFAGFPGFRPTRLYPAYSRDFFDGGHFVLKGASPVTSSTLVRRTFRNWFQPHYPFVYAKFRTVGD